MTSKLEEAAKAHWQERQNQSAWPPIPWELTTKAERKRQIAEMRAALKVLREPDEAMRHAGVCAANSCGVSMLPSEAGAIQTAGIDAILQEGE